MASKAAATEHIQSKDDDVVDLVVGGYRYTTSRSVLLSSPFHTDNGDNGENYFQALLSGRWKRTKLSQPIEIPDMDGRLFLYVLQFLQVGQLPRKPKSEAHECVLSKEDIDGLELQADFFGLQGLVDLCKTTKDVLKGVTGTEGVTGTGDLDLTPYSDFSINSEFEQTRYAHDFNFSMTYTYKNDDIRFSMTDAYQNPNSEQSVEVRVYSRGKDDSDKKMDSDDFEETFGCLVKLIKEEYKTVTVLSVTHLLQKANIPREFWLWYAFVVNDMIDSYKIYHTFDGGEFSNGIEFLFSDTSSSFVRMDSVK
jgi:hypothetical protein